MSAHVQHTPGPWVVGLGNEIGPRQRERTRISREADGSGVAFLIRQGLPSDEANARLIAAAPELLAACKKAVEAIYDEVSAADDDDHPTIADHARVLELCQRAIAKAEGGQP